MLQRAHAARVRAQHAVAVALGVVRAGGAQRGDDERQARLRQHVCEAFRRATVARKDHVVGDVVE